MPDRFIGLYYFAHPYQAKDKDGNIVFQAQEANFRLCCQRTAELFKHGFNVYSPICQSHSVHCHDPQYLTSYEWDLWIEADLHLLSRVNWDGIIVAPGWQDSTGCRGEVDWFRRELSLEPLEYSQVVNDC